jgi:hypothetical protein
MGPDAAVLQTSSQGNVAAGFGGPGSLGIGDFAIRQAYIALRTPICNGIDWKIGVFDSIIGYESVASPNNPNYTRSFGHSIEPQTHTGILGSYRLNDIFSISAGIANTLGPTIDGKANPPQAESYKSYMGSLAVTAPDNWGFLAGSTLYAGIVNGFSSSYFATTGGTTTSRQTSYYLGATLATPVTGLRVGAALDVLDVHNLSGETWDVALYASYQMTEKMSFHGRAEYLRDRGNQTFFATAPQSGASSRVFELTTTLQYDLWQNVLTRLEFRWDHSADGSLAFGGKTPFSTPTRHNAYLLAANIVYKF